MSISNNKRSIDETLNSIQGEAKELELEQRAEKIIEKIEATVINKALQSKWPCVAMVWALLGTTAHMASDEVEELKSTVTDLLVFLTDPEIAKRFEKVRGYQSKDFATHLKRLMAFCDDADKREIYAEIALFELQSFGYTDTQIERLESDFLS
jgi:hypothetical protein